MTTSLDVEVRVVSPAEWSTVRRLRLRALVTDPEAYLSSHAEESAWDEGVWRRTFETSRWLVASYRGWNVGLLRSVRDEEHPFARYVESIWVAPRYRRHGVLTRMLRILAQRESRWGFTELKLWVLEHNTDALQVYPRVGFRSTGVRQTLESAVERQFSRTIASP